ncbi:MAG TPA: TauD/TfdA family dioxygenase [Novosphingobium sp.]
MATAVSSRWEVTEVAPRIGSAIHADKQTLLSGEKAQEIRRILEERGVIVFPKIDFTTDEQIAFTHTLGTFAHQDGEGEPDVDSVYPITMDPKVNPNASYLRGAFYWHLDGTMSRKPILASIMSAHALATEGGDTGFCNTYAAYDDLSDEDKARYEGLQVVHSFWRSQLYHEPEPSYELLKRWQAVGENTLPLVWKHRSGRKSLVLGNTATRVEGMSPGESEALLIKLRDWATSPQFSYQHKWSLGDLVIWDNTGTMHRATPYAFDSGRLMLRTKLEGEESFD